MKTNFSSKVRSLILAASLTGGIGFLSPAFGQSFDTSYLIDLNTKEWTKLEALGDSTSVWAINDSGRVVGTASTSPPSIPVQFFIPSFTSFITGPNGVGITELGFNPRDLNNAGQVVGGLQEPPDVPLFFHSYITGPNGEGRTSIDSLAKDGSDFTRAYGINDAGRVVGGSWTGENGGSEHAFITGPNGTGTTDLGLFGGTSSRAIDINNTAQVAVEAGMADGSTHAFITGPNGLGMTDLSTLGGASSFVSGINDSGQVVGRSETATGSEHAFVTGPNGQGMIDLGTLGGSFSDAVDINESGQVVGNSETATGSRHAFITGPDGTGMTDLNSLVDLPKGIILANATGINNVGQVVAIAVVPEPSSYALMLAGLTLVGMVVRRKKLSSTHHHTPG